MREIRRRQFGRYVYLILLTAREDHGDLTQGFEAGADDFLSKPVEQSELRARLHAGRGSSPSRLTSPRAMRG